MLEQTRSLVDRAIGAGPVRLTADAIGCSESGLTQMRYGYKVFPHVVARLLFHGRVTLDEARTILAEHAEQCAAGYVEQAATRGTVLTPAQAARDAERHKRHPTIEAFAAGKISAEEALEQLPPPSPRWSARQAARPLRT
jgi:hypothetical protein